MNLTVDTNTLFVDGSVHRVGIGTLAPNDVLEVVGNVRVFGSLNASSINTTGNAYFATNSGSVGIGATSPNYLLQGGSGTDGRSVNLSNVLYVNGSSGFVGIGTTSPVNALTIIGSVSTFGSLNATFINATEIRVGSNIVQVEKDSFKQGNYSSEYASIGYKIGNYSSEYASTGYKLSNFTSNYDARSDRYSITNYSAEYASTGYKLANFTSNLNSVNASISLWNGTTNIYPREITGNVGIGTTAPTEALVVVGNANITGTLYKGTSAYGNPDIAEKIESTQLLEEGDVVVADENKDNHVVKSAQPYQNIFGVVSPNAAMVIGNWRGGFSGYNIALLGRVAVKVSLENGPVKRGDALAASSKEGYAMKAMNSGRIIGFALEDYDESKKPIELEGTKTEQFKARFSRDLGKKKLREKAEDIIKEGKIKNSESPVTGNAVNEAGLETDLSQILEAETSVFVENNSNNAPGENEIISQANETLNNQNTAQTINENNDIGEIESLDDLKRIYKKARGKDIEDDENDFRKMMEVADEIEKLEAEAKNVEDNATPKMLIVLSPGWHSAGETAAQQPAQQSMQQTLELSGYSKVNGSIILRLG